MKKLTVFLAMAAVVLFTGTAWAQNNRFEVAPRFPSPSPNPYIPNPNPPGSYFNPYVIRNQQTGKEWEVRPTYPTSNRRNDPNPAGSYFNPWVVEER